MVDVRKVVDALERRVQEDPGKRGIAHLHIPGELYRAACALRSASSVAIVTGFSIPPTETDGPLGAMAIARALLCQGKRVRIVTDSENKPPLQSAWEYVLDHSESWISADALARLTTREIMAFPAGSAGDAASAAAFFGTEDGCCVFDHVVSIERVGKASDGRCYNMRGEDIFDHNGLLDFLFDFAASHREYGIQTTGIGDGGNEVGMGRVVEAVQAHVPHGARIACRTPTDFLVTAGVSNWGGWALAGALAVLASDPTCLPCVESERDILHVLVDHGAIDGVLRQSEASVDGLPFDPSHACILNDMKRVIIP